MRRPLALAAFLSLSMMFACESPRSTQAADAGGHLEARTTSASLSLPAIDAGSYAPTTEQQALVQRLAGSIVVGGHAMDYLRELADGIGPRLTGSEAHARAAAWAADSFRKAGVTAVAIEPFTIPVSWERRPATAKIVAPVAQDLHAVGMGWAPPTGPEGIRADVVLVKDMEPGALAKQGEVLRGKIALLERDSYKNARKKLDPRVALSKLKPLGVVGLASIASRDNDVLGATSVALESTLVGPFPAVGIGKEDGERIKRLLEKGPVTLSFVNESPTGGAKEVPNVIAEIRGRESPNEWVLVGAHLDSWDLATGAQDNGSGAAEVIEAARAIGALGAPPRRSIRFALWGGEEEGLLGSRAYADAHSADLDNAVYVLNTDHGAGAPKGLNLDGREDAIDALRPVATSLLAGLGAEKLASEINCNTDHCPFMLKGVPTANLEVDDTKYDDVHHTPADTLEKVSPGSLAQGAAVVAIAAYAIADAPGRLAKRLDHAGVAANLKKAELVDNLASSGIWKP